MNCPKCKKEYKDQITVCPDCGEKLISTSTDTDTDTDTDQIVYEAMKPVKLINVTNSIEAGIIMNLLLNNNIPCIKKDKFLGGYMNLYMGYSVYGEDIYVDEGDYEKALDVISILTPEEDTEVSDTGESYANASEQLDAEYNASEDADEQDNISPIYSVFYKNPKIVARIILGFILAGALFTTIINYIY
jgi:hypothetical protein